MIDPVLTRLDLRSTTDASHSLTSIPWPADRDDFPAIEPEHQIVRLFQEHARPRLRRFLLLTHASPLLREIELRSTRSLAPEPAEYFSQVEMRTLRESLDKTRYVYRENEARLRVCGHDIGLRMGLLPNTNVSRADEIDAYSWWQWGRAERVWSGALAEAWRIGGHLVPYTIDAPGKWDRPELTDLGELLNRFCGDILHGDLFAIVWRDGLIQLTAHFKSAYFHTFPKEIPAFPVIYLDGLATERGTSLCFSPCNMMLNADMDKRNVGDQTEQMVLRPWNDLRFLAGKDKHGGLFFLPPEAHNVLPAGVSRSCWFNIAPDGMRDQVARYRVTPDWYRACGVVETERAGPASLLAARNAQRIRECTQVGGIDTGRVWRYLKRAEILKIAQEDGAEWEGNLAQAMFTLAYQLGEDPAQHWPTYLHHAYHAADVSIYHGAWMGRLECTAAMSAPLPKFRFGGFLFGYLETGDPYLLELSRSVAGVYMAMEWALEPRVAIGRDSYPITCLMALYDYTADAMYLDFARQMCTRLLSTQRDDGGFTGQAGAGVLTGTSCVPGVRDIHFGNGILSPIALLEWATRDPRWPADFLPKLRKWVDLMLTLQKPDGHWYVEGRSDEPYTLTGSATVWSLIKAGQILNEPRCVEAVKKYLDAMNAKQAMVLGTHAFLSVLYAHVADGALLVPSPPGEG